MILRAIGSTHRDWRDEPEGRARREAYYCSDAWSRLRQVVRERAGGICERCHAAPMQALHHLTYERLYCEDLNDLQGLCDPCHQYVHDRLDEDPIFRTERSP